MTDAYDYRHESKYLAPSTHGIIFHLLAGTFLTYFIVKGALFLLNLWCSYSFLTGFWVEVGIGIPMVIWGGLLLFPTNMMSVATAAQAGHSVKFSARHTMAIRTMVLMFFLFFFVGLVAFPLIYYMDFTPGTSYIWCLVDQQAAAVALDYGKETLMQNVVKAQLVTSSVALLFLSRALAYHLNPEIAVQRVDSR